MTTAIVIEDDWSIVNEQIESMSSSTEDCMANQSSSLDSAPIPIVGGYVRVSYKDMLLKKGVVDEGIATILSDQVAIAPRQPWKPRIEVMSNTPWKRVDREYGSNSSQVGGYYDEYDGMNCHIYIHIRIHPYVRTFFHCLLSSCSRSFVCFCSYKMFHLL